MKNLRQVKSTHNIQGGENVNLADVIMNGRKVSFEKRLSYFEQFLGRLSGNQQPLYFRSILSAADREVQILTHDGRPKKMLMFGSNNYLGLANHPYVREKVKEAIDKYGVGIGGPPILNGYSKLMFELEERLSHLKDNESTLIFSSGYNANVGMVTGLCTPNDIIISDEYSHASFCDGVKMLRGNHYTFRHNQIQELEQLLKIHHTQVKGNIFVGVEGIYSMEGDLAPLDKIVPLCRAYKAILLLDDAHATGVIGSKGGGAHDHFNLSPDTDIILGTFSKTFAVNGGFISASEPVIRYLRFMARSYMFSASLPPVTLAAVLAGLDVLEKEPQLRQQLQDNVQYVVGKLRKFGLVSEPDAAIVSLKIPKGKDIRKLAHEFHDAGIFLNAIEYPAVPKDRERFRISIMANHTKNDLNQLVRTVEEIWHKASKIDDYENCNIC